MNHAINFIHDVETAATAAADLAAPAVLPISATQLVLQPVSGVPVAVQAPVRLLVLSDLHLEFALFQPPDPALYDIVVLAGDIRQGPRAVQWAGLGGVFRGSIWAPPLPPAYGSPAERLKVIRPRERWRGGIPLRHRSSIWPDEVDRLSRQRAEVLVTHEAPGGLKYGWPALDDLAVAMAVQVLVHGHHHRPIDYIREGRLPRGCRYQAFGVGREDFLVWPPAIQSRGSEL